MLAIAVRTTLRATKRRAALTGAPPALRRERGAIPCGTASLSSPPWSSSSHWRSPRRRGATGRRIARRASGSCRMTSAPPSSPSRRLAGTSWRSRRRAPSRMRARVARGRTTSPRPSTSTGRRDRAAESLGGEVVFRYDTARQRLLGRALAGGRRGARRACRRPASSRSRGPAQNETSVPFIGATEVWNKLGVKGQGMRVAVVDTGIDYTHANFGGPGTVEAYESNDPTFIEPGTFPTKQGDRRLRLRRRRLRRPRRGPSNDVPRPDADPLDDGSARPRLAHRRHLLRHRRPGRDRPGRRPGGEALRDQGLGTRATRPTTCSSPATSARSTRTTTATRPTPPTSSRSRAASTTGPLNSVEARAAQRVVDVGTVFVASAGQLGQPARRRLRLHRRHAGDGARRDRWSRRSTSSTRRRSPSTARRSSCPTAGSWSSRTSAAAPPERGLTADLFDGRELDPPADPGKRPRPKRQFLATRSRQDADRGQDRAHLQGRDRRGRLLRLDQGVQRPGGGRAAPSS